ncbi:MAG: serine/threonine-protein kinase, partial [Pyrinomonadaceae bacterium]
MNPSEWERAKELFERTRELPVEERAAFLERVCSSEPEVRTQVERLLAAYDTDFLEESILPKAVDQLASNHFQPDQVVGRYRIGELIGTGGMGQVFRAEDTELDRPVAFKVLHGDIAENDERVRRFIQEAKAASALNHPNILTIHEIGTFEGARFIVSEFVNGDTLRERMRSGLTSAESLDIMCQIAAALQAAHSAGIVHRDIKPENIMLRQDGLVKVLDFGLAKLTEADDLPIDATAPAISRFQTSPGLIMGTVAYMSPEQARGQAVDSRTDLWSLGVVFHEMLTGESPFKGESVTDLVTSILNHEAASLDLTAISQELKPICTKALAKDKKARYQTAQDLLQDLQGE